MGGAVLPGVDLAFSSVRDTRVTDDVVAVGAASDSRGVSQTLVGLVWVLRWTYRSGLSERHMWY